MPPLRAELWEGAWTEQTPTNGSARVFQASWARGEPRRGAYDDAELARWRKAAVATRRHGVEVWVVAHAGALPDWQIGRGGWTDPDVLATWGCWIERLGRALLDQVDGWFALADPIGEAAAYDGSRRAVGRTLLHAQANAWTELRRGSGLRTLPVGASFLAPSGPLQAVATRAWITCASTGKLLLPWGIAGVVSEHPVLDVVALLGPVPGVPLHVPRVQLHRA